MKRHLALVTAASAVVSLLLSQSSTARAAPIAILHNFSGADGNGPVAGLTLSGATLYGTTQFGGLSNDGTIFNINTDASGFSVMHNFSGSDGSQPYADVTLSGSTLYGTTAYGGTSNDGTIFKVNTDGTGHTVIYNYFLGPPYGPNTTYADLTLSGSTLYGTTIYGGTNGGAVFSVSTNGNGYTELHSFGSALDGKYPDAGVTLSGSTLYGTTLNGGTSNDSGTVFRVDIDGTGPSILHSFSNTSGGDGGNPLGDLLLDGSTLYGVTRAGGPAFSGTVFKVNTDGTGYAILHTFAQPGDGGSPDAGLTLLGSTLYGTTGGGGAFGDGTIFSINEDGSGYSILHDFSGMDGSTPYSALTLSGSTLYGTTEFGGLSNDGVVFAISTPEPSSLILLGLGGLAICGRAIRKRG